MVTSSRDVVYLKRLRYWRERRAMTQAELAELIGYAEAEVEIPAFARMTTGESARA